MRTPQRPGSDRGFTLLELIVVLTIISVLMAVTAPRLAGRSQASALRSAGHQLQTLAAAARARAVLSGRVVGVMLSADGDELRLVRASAGEGEGETTLTDLLPTRRLPATVRASFQPDGDGEANLMRFRPDGSADGGTVDVRHRQGQVLRLHLSESLGRLRVREPT